MKGIRKKDHAQVGEIMSRSVATCRPEEPLHRAAQLMWERDCGCIPVVDSAGKVAGFITDRDICMAAYTRGKSLSEVPIGEVMSRKVVTCRSDEPIAVAEAMMRSHQVRRLPVVDNGRVVGLLSLNDLALAIDRHRASAESVAETLAAIDRHRAPVAKRTPRPEIRV